MDKKSLICIGVVALLGLGATIFAYTSAKQSYQAVGFNDGTLTQKYEVVDTLEKIKKLEQCPASDNLIEFISVKNTNVKAIKTKDGSLIFCLL